MMSWHGNAQRADTGHAEDSLKRDRFFNGSKVVARQKDRTRGGGTVNARIVTRAAAALAFFLECGLVRAGPMVEPPAATGQVSDQVTAVIRNDLGQLKWVVTAPTGYTKLEAEGRHIYMQSGCSFCHSQYERPADGETRPWGLVSADPRRWGPFVETGEYAFDRPPLFGARGIAPDLSREGLKYSDEWHLAHFWNPPMMTKGSIMGGFSGLFDAPPAPVGIVDGASGKTLAATPATRRLFDFTSKDQVKLTPNAQGLLFVPLVALHKYPLIWLPNNEYAGSTVRVVAETPAIGALIAYVQKLGMNRGKWRDMFLPAAVDGSAITLPRSDAWIAHGKQVFEAHCIACHGVKGDGNGTAATFLYRQRPRNFTFGEFKFRTTKGPLPTDADLLRTITRGVRGTAMPAWFELPIDDRLAVIQYVKYVLAVDRSDPQKADYYFLDQPPEAPLVIGAPPPPTPGLVAHGRQVWLQAKCWTCHGKSGAGDGEQVGGLKDDWGFPIRPANLTAGQFKSGPNVADIYRTVSTGLTGTPMPSFHDSLADADRWALAYYVLSLSAFRDPLTGAKLSISAADRAALDNPQMETRGSKQAYRLTQH
jgi:cytochrome c oxidase cbb3-type subunit I/II